MNMFTDASFVVPHLQFEFVKRILTEIGRFGRSERSPVLSLAAIVASRRGRCDPADEECRGTPVDTARTIESD